MGTFLSSHIMPHFGKRLTGGRRISLLFSQSLISSSEYFLLVDPAMKLFILLAHVTIGIGALVSGVVGALLPKITSGIMLAILLTLLASVVSKHRNSP